MSSIDIKNMYFIVSEAEKIVRSKPQLQALEVMDLTFKNLQNMDVRGTLENMYFDQGVLIFVYDENTFSQEYKDKYPEYFLDTNAPLALKNLFYRPVINSRAGYEKKKLDYETFEKYFDYLKDKYLDRFEIAPFDLFKIKMVKEQQSNQSARR